MRCLIGFGIALFGLTVSLPALAQPALTAAAIDQKAKLLGPRKATYLMRQLDLTEQQAAHIQGLIDSILPADENVPVNVDEVRRLYREFEAAKAADDQARVAEITEQLQAMGKEATDDGEFYDNVAAQLTDEQQTKLAAAQERLARHPSGALRPIDLLRAAWELNPTDEQRARLRTVQEDYRKTLYPNLRPDEKLKLKLINFLHDQTRAVLTPEQRTPWDRRVRTLRPDLIDEGLRVKMSEPAPTDPHAGEQDRPAEE